MSSATLQEEPRALLADAVNDSSTPYSSSAYGKAAARAVTGRWLAIVAEGWRLPLVLSGAPDALEASTPYGYGGLQIADHVDDQRATVLWERSLALLADLGAVSLFLRLPPYRPIEAHRASRMPGLDVRHASDTVLVPVQDDEAMLAAMGSSTRRRVRQALRDMDAQVLPVTDASAELEAFLQLYGSTMDRLDAPDALRFERDYFDALIEGLGERLLLSVVRSGSEVIAASLVIDDGSIIHSHLSASAPPGSHPGANNLGVWSELQLARRLGRSALHLGGGTRPDDSLFAFKAGFGGRAVPFHVASAVLDQARYAALVRQRAVELGTTPDTLERADYFPAFRARPQEA